MDAGAVEKLREGGGPWKKCLSSTSHVLPHTPLTPESGGVTLTGKVDLPHSSELI